MNALVLSAQRVALAITGNGFVDSLLTRISGILLGVLALFLLITIFTEGMALRKGDGNGSLVKMLTKVGLFIVVMGLIIMVATNYDKIAGAGGKIIDKGIDAVDKEASNLAASTPGNGKVIKVPGET